MLLRGEDVSLRGPEKALRAQALALKLDDAPLALGLRDEAAQWGIETRSRAFDIADLRTVLAAGGAALVLVDTLLVTGDLCPHWIFVHGLHHDAEAGECFLIHDPWTEWEQGESWVDACDVLVTADALDKIAWTGDPAVRAMLTFTT